MRPTQRMRMPSSSISSRRRRMTSRLKFMRNFTSSGERFQFSVENAYSERFLTPISMQPLRTSMTTPSPTLWPSVRGSPRSLAQRPFPSITTATCLGTSSPGIFGGVAPEGCGSGVLYSRRLRPPSIPRTAMGFSRLPVSLFHVPQRAQAALEMPVQIGGHESAPLPDMTRLGRVRRLPVTGEQGAQQFDGLRRGYHAPGYPAVAAYDAARRHGEEPVRSGHTALGAVDEAGGVAVDGQGAQQEGVQDEVRRVFGACEGAQPADEQQVLLDRGLALVVGEPLGGLQHRGAGGVAGVVGDDAAAVGGDRLALGAQRQAAADQLAAAREELHVHVGEGLQTGPELRLGAAHPARHGTHPPVAAGQDRDDPVGLAQLLRAQHDAVVPEQAHGSIVAHRAGRLSAVLGGGVTRSGPREAPTGPGKPQEGVRAASSSFAVSAGQSCSAPPTVVSTSRSAWLYGPSARAIRAPRRRIASRPGTARCGASGFRTSCSSMARAAPQASAAASLPSPWPASAASTSTMVKSCSWEQSSSPASRTTAAAVSRTVREVVPPAARTARVTVCTASRSMAEKRVVVGWSRVSGSKCVPQAAHSTTGPAVPRASSGSPRTVRRWRPVRRR